MREDESKGKQDMREVTRKEKGDKKDERKIRDKKMEEWRGNKRLGKWEERSKKE